MSYNMISYFFHTLKWNKFQKYIWSSNSVNISLQNTNRQEVSYSVNQARANFKWRSMYVLVLGAWGSRVREVASTAVFRNTQTQHSNQTMLVRIPASQFNIRVTVSESFNLSAILFPDSWNGTSMVAMITNRLKDTEDKTLPCTD